MASAIYHPNASEYQQRLLSGGKSKGSDRLMHTARGLEAIGFDENSSMYHVGSEDAHEEKENKEHKSKKAFIKKLVGVSNEKGEKL